VNATSHNTEPKRDRQDDWQEDLRDEEPVRIYSAQEIRAIQAHQPRLSIGRIVVGQWLAALLLTLLALVSGLTFQPQSTFLWASSVGWGALCAALPSSLMAWGLRTRHGDAAHNQSAGFAGLHLMRFAVWELAKIIISVVLLVISPWVIPQVHWLLLVLSFVVVLKVFWLAAVMQLKRVTPPSQSHQRQTAQV
jgi:ATP synthase protein I